MDFVKGLKQRPHLSPGRLPRCVILLAEETPDSFASGYEGQSQLSFLH